MAKDTPISFVSINRAAAAQPNFNEDFELPPAKAGQARPQSKPNRSAPAYYVPDEKSAYARFKDWFIDLCFEKPVPERPIGLSQLSRKTFVATEAIPVYGQQQMVQQQRVVQDYRFSQLVNRGR